VHTDYQALPRVNTRLRGIAGWGLGFRGHPEILDPVEG